MSEPSLSAILDSSAGWNALNGQWRYEGRSWSIITDRTVRVLPEDVPEDVVSTLPGISHLTDMHLSISAPTPPGNCFPGQPGAKALAQALEVDMADWWQASAANYFGRVKRDQIVEAMQEATGAPVDERLKSAKKKDLAE